MTYKLTVKSAYVIRVRDNAWIPPDLNNVDWRDYLDWCRAGNTALPADAIMTFEIAANDFGLLTDN